MQRMHMQPHAAAYVAHLHFKLAHCAADRLVRLHAHRMGVFLTHFKAST
jgi:hypothetical protein